MLAIRGRDICDGKLSIKRLKKSRPTLHALRIDRNNVLFDESPLLDLAAARPNERLSRWSRQYTDRIFKRYSELARIHPSKSHYHVLKHSICVLLWQETHDLNAIQDHIGHRSSSSTLLYLPADAALKAQNTVATMSFTVETSRANVDANFGTSLSHP
jgi:Phage integrase family